MNMIERVAEVIFPRLTTMTDKINNPIMWNMAVNIARECIEAMREPSEDMVISGSLDPGAGGPDRKYAGEVWQAMIDTALKEE